MRRPVHLLLAALAAVALLAPPAVADDYTDPDYAQHEADNLTRGRGMQLYQLTSPDYHAAFIGASGDSFLNAQAHQVNDARYGRAYVGASQYMSTWGVGNAEDYFDVTPREVAFLSQTGAKLYGHIWGDEQPGPRPGVVITTGSIQGSNQMYWWAARALAAAGYTVLTYDVQGQGQSETFGHEPGSAAPTTEGVPFQQSFNFVQGTIDAMRFFLSTPEDPYLPVGWTEDDVALQQAFSDGERLDWHNPGHAALDRDHIGIAGHSLGAAAVSEVQQCADSSDRYLEVEACHGEAYPIRAVIGWDQLRGGEDIVPVVPGMNQAADGYFLSPTPSPTAPDPEEHLTAHRAWTAAGLDTYTVVVRAGTHLEWSQVAYHGPATRYGEALAAYYTVAWMDRWVPHDPARNAAAHQALLEGPRPADEAAPSSAAYMSVRRLSAFTLTDPVALAQDPATAPVEVVDLRVHAGRSAVGDWAGANADTVGAVLPE